MFDSPLSRSAYEVLGVDPSADVDALRRAFRLRLRQTHPDAGGEAAEFIDVQRAWELVGTEEARVAYDRGHGFVGDSDWRGWSAPPAPRDSRLRYRVRKARNLGPGLSPFPGDAHSRHRSRIAAVMLCREPVGRASPRCVPAKHSQPSPMAQT
ncbi:hypothetical protein GCM10027064_19470 [Microbacterium petrolearium]